MGPAIVRHILLLENAHQDWNANMILNIWMLQERVLVQVLLDFPCIINTISLNLMAESNVKLIFLPN